MNKKLKQGILVTTKLVNLILAIAVIFGSVYFMGQTLWPSFKAFMGVSDPSVFDSSIERYSEMGAEHAEAMDSINALLYAINVLAWADESGYSETVPGTTDEREYIGQYSELERTFGDKIVKATAIDSETVGLRGSTTQVAYELAKLIVECRYIYEDLGYSNTRCFTVDTNGLQGHITETELIDGIHAYKDSAECEGNCEWTCDELTGEGWFLWNIFNAKNLRIEINGGDYRDTVSSEVTPLRLCADTHGLDEIMITDNSQLCHTPYEQLVLGFKIENFNLPQEVIYEGGHLPVVSQIAYTIDSWLRGFGDPKYVIYYGVFPEGEEEYWGLAGYQIAWASILIGEGIGLGIDLLTFGFGRFFSRGAGRAATAVAQQAVEETGQRVITETVQEGTEQVIKQSFKETIGEFFERIWSRTGRRLFTKSVTRAGLHDAAGEAAEEGVQRIVRRACVETGVENVDEVVDAARGLYRDAAHASLDFLDEVEDPIREGFVDASGRLTREGRERALTRMTDYFDDALVHDPVLRGTLQDALGQNFDRVIVNLQREITDGFLSRIGRLSRIQMFFRRARRGMLTLAQVFDPELPQDQLERAVRGFMDDGLDHLRYMHDQDLIRFMANQQPAIDLFMDRGSGEFIRDATEGILIDNVDDFSRAFDDGIRNALREQSVDTFIDLPARYTRVITGERMLRISKGIYGFATPRILPTNPRAVRRLALWTTAYYLVSRVESMHAKFVPVGPNAIGFRTPYDATVIYDDTYTRELDLETQEDYLNFFRHYADYYYWERARAEEGLTEEEEEGGEESQEVSAPPREYQYYYGLLPLVDKYYIALIKDMHDDILGTGWRPFDQLPQRFHLVSPCKADILMKVSRCECVQRDEPQNNIYLTGKHYVLNDGTEIFYDPNPDPNEPPFTYRLDEENQPYKECFHPDWFPLDDYKVNVKCIQINPVMDQTLDPNYCYHGSNPGHETMKFLTTVVEFAVPVVVGIFCQPCAIPIGFAVGLAGESLKAYVDTQHRWPHHS
ncbi:hypothetical protein JW930_00060 [Candidatus Woesearchaeota archaeon]|nr:hypothetical protein [Candidatus Woesearchaeota archaeon]